MLSFKALWFFLKSNKEDDEQKKSSLFLFLEKKLLYFFLSKINLFIIKVCQSLILSRSVSNQRLQYLRKLERTGRVSGRMTRRSIFNGELEIDVIALTVVNRRISFFNLSRNMGRQLGSSVCRLSPRCAIICPMQEMALSFTSWSISWALNLQIKNLRLRLPQKNAYLTNRLLKKMPTAKFNTFLEKYLKLNCYSFQRKDLFKQSIRNFLVVFVFILKL